MRVTIYSKRHTMSDFFGLVIQEHTYDDDFFGEPPIHGEKITKEEYDELSQIVSNPALKRGFEGFVNEEGYAKYLAKLSEMENQNAM